MNPMQDSLQERLKRDATQDAPTFDERLHERVMRHVQTNATTRSASREIDERRPKSRVLWIGPALGMAALLAVVVGMWWEAPKSQVVPPVVHATSIPMPDEILLAHATQLHARAWDRTEQPLMALQGDAVRFTQFLAGQLNVVPTQQ